MIFFFLAFVLFFVVVFSFFLIIQSQAAFVNCLYIARFTIVHSKTQIKFPLYKYIQVKNNNLSIKKNWENKNVFSLTLKHDRLVVVLTTCDLGCSTTLGQWHKSAIPTALWRFHWSKVEWGSLTRTTKTVTWRCHNTNKRRQIRRTHII